MLENSTSLMRAFPASAMPSRLMGGIETIDGAMNMPVPFVQEGVTDLYVLEKDSDSPYRGKEERSVAFERWPNIGEEIVTPTQAQASLSSIITQLQTSARAELPEAKKESFTQISFQARSEGLSVESLLFALQEFLVGKRVLIHVSSENALKAMQTARDMSNERQIKMYEEQSKAAEKERNHQRWSGLAVTLILGSLAALAGTLFILPIIAAGGSLLTVTAASSILMLMGGATSLVKAGFQGAQIYAASKGEARAVKDLQKTTNTLGHVEATFMWAALGVDVAVLTIGWVGIGRAMVETMGESVGANVSTHELQNFERVAEGTAEVRALQTVKTAEETAITADLVRASWVTEFSGPKFSGLEFSGLEFSGPEFTGILEKALKRVRWQNFDLKKIDAIIEAAHKEARIAQEGNQALEYAKAFDQELYKLLCKHLLLEPKASYSIVMRVGMRGVMAAAVGMLEHYAAEAKYLANTLNAQLKLEREVQQLLTQKAITDKLEDLEKNTQEMGKILKDIVEWVTQFIEAKRKAIDALALIR